ncbi:MAG: efflux transporter periplasmic adaptor subunit, partial [Muribaculaceae bacterium]|nr:efflux transporter periplasmic adaptor subunit [Muribaculaceae bacterium]
MKKIFYTVLTLILCLTTGCHSHENHDDHDHDPVHNHGGKAPDALEAHDDEDEAHNPDEIILTPEKAKAAGVVVESVVPSDFNAVI